MLIVGELAAVLKLDDTQYNKGLDKAKSNWMKMAADLKGMGATMTAAITAPLLLIGGGAIKMAMEAVESENLFEVSMGNMAGSARKWSETLRAELGLNAYEVRKNVGTFYNMFSSMKLGEKNAYTLSTGLTKLAYDMSSFYNISFDEAFTKLSAGITGETEPLKRLGIIVNEATVQQYAYKAGIAKAGTQLSEQQKVMGRYLAIMDQTKTAQGDLARTMDSPTNQLRIMQETIKQTAIDLGMALMPVMKDLMNAIKPIIETIKGWVNWFTHLDEGTRKNIVTVLLLAAALGPLLWAIGSVMGAVGQFLPIFMGIWKAGGAVIFAFKAVAGGASTIGEAFMFLGGKPLLFLKNSVISLGKAFWALLTSPITWIILGIMVLAAIVYLLIKNWQQAAPFFKALWGYILGVFKVAGAGIMIVVREIQLGIAYWLNLTYGNVAKFVTAILEKFSWMSDIPGLGWLYDKMKAVTSGVADLTQGFVDSSKASLDEAKGNWAEATGEMTGHWDVLKDAGKALGGAMMNTVNETIASAKNMFGGAGENGMDNLKEKAGGATQAVNELDTSVGALGDTLKKTGKNALKDLEGMFGISDAGVIAARAMFERSMATNNFGAAGTSLSILRNAGAFGSPHYAGGTPGGSSVNHTGTIRVEGVNSKGQLVGVTEVVAKDIQVNQDRYATQPSGRRVFR